MGTVLVLALVASAAPAQAPPCGKIASAEIVRRMDAIMAVPGWQDLGEVARLIRYWRTRCATERRDASPFVVRQLARALPDVWRRAHATDLLIDIGPNLGFIRRDIHAAIRDQRRRDRAVARASAGSLLPGNYGYSLTCLRCLATKISTGRIDPRLCRDIEETNRGSDEYWAHPPDEEKGFPESNFGPPKR